MYMYDLEDSYVGLLLQSITYIYSYVYSKQMVRGVMLYLYLNVRASLAKNACKCYGMWL